jgi:acetolactate synthase-1/3 small subunit
MISEFSRPSGEVGRAMRTLIAYVEDKPGILNRVVSLFRRRGYNIESLTVGRTEREGISRITLVVEADDDTARRLEANLYKLVNVLYVEDITQQPSVHRELALIKVKATAEKRNDLLQLCDVFRARIVDIRPGSIIAEITGAQEKIDGLIDVLRPFGITELVRTGLVAMVRAESKNETGPQLSVPDDEIAA